MIRKLFCFLVILWSLCVSAYAQDPQQYETQTIDGIEYYIYHVKQSEGLYRISVNFGVSQDEIIRINPEVKNGLKVGQLLFIPKQKTTTPTTKETQRPQTGHPATTHTPVPVDLIASSLGNGSTSVAPAEQKPIQANRQLPSDETEPNFYYHKVQKQQTLYSLSKQYGVKQEDIIKYNPQAASGLKTGEVLRIPKPEDIYQDKKTEKMQEDLSVKYLVHKVEPKETLYSISKKYAVEINDITKLNPELEVLTIGQELKIPYYAALMTTDTVNGKTQTFIDWDKLFWKKAPAKSANLRIAFLLPFILEDKNDANITRFVDFYGGAVKALYEARARGITIDVYTYDTGKTAERLQQIFNANPQLKDMDLIVGPAYSAQVPVATAFAKAHEVKTLIPFTSKVADIENNPYLFQFNPGTEAETEFLKNMFETKLDDLNYIFADIQYVPETDEGDMLSKQLKAMLDAQGKSYHTLEISDPAINPFDSVATYSKRNLVIFNTDQFQVAQPYFENLNLTDRRYDILLLERFSWKNQETFRPVGVYVSAFKMESDINGLEQYNKEFADLLGWNALAKNPRYDLLGYDLTNYFIQLLVTDAHNGIEQKLELEMYMEGMQSQFRFKRDSIGSGFINQQVYLGDSQAD